MKHSVTVFSTEFYGFLRMFMGLMESVRDDAKWSNCRRLMNLVSAIWVCEHGVQLLKKAQKSSSSWKCVGPVTLNIAKILCMRSIVCSMRILIYWGALQLLRRIFPRIHCVNFLRLYFNTPRTMIKLRLTEGRFRVYFRIKDFISS